MSSWILAATRTSRSYGAACTTRSRSARTTRAMPTATTANEADIVVNCPVLGIVKPDHQAPVVMGARWQLFTVTNNGEGAAFRHRRKRHASTLVHLVDQIADRCARLDPHRQPAVGQRQPAPGTSWSMSWPRRAPRHGRRVRAQSEHGLGPHRSSASGSGRRRLGRRGEIPEMGVDNLEDDADGNVDQPVTFTILAQVAARPVTDAVVADTLRAGRTHVAGSQSSKTPLSLVLGLARRGNPDVDLRGPATANQQHESPTTSRSDTGLPATSSTWPSSASPKC